MIAYCYVGIDNFKAGKSAAKISEAMCRKGGKVLVITPQYLAKSQVERFKGFSQFFEEVGFSNKLVFFQRKRKPNVDLENLSKTLKANSDTRVLYSPINDNFLELVIETGRHDEGIRSLAKIVHDLSSHSVECLATGLIDIVWTQILCNKCLRPLNLLPLTMGIRPHSVLLQWIFSSTRLKICPRENFLPKFER